MNIQRAPARQLMEVDFGYRIFSEFAECPYDAVDLKVQEWRDLGRYIVFTAGCYDILGLNHIRGLVQCRAFGAMSLLGLETVSNDDEFNEVHRIASSNEIALIVTVDTDEAMASNKSRNSSNGNSLKPTLGWETRVAMLASQSIPTNDGQNRINLVDYITRHGEHSCCVHGECCINADNAQMSAKFRPDLVVVNSGSLKTISDTSEYIQNGAISDTKLIIFEECEGAYYDQLLGGIISTTAIIDRVRL